MLVLSLREGEGVSIGNDVVVFFMGRNPRSHDAYQLGINAPVSTRIIRADAVKKSKQQKERSA